MKSKIARSEIAGATGHLFLCEGGSCCKSKIAKDMWKTLKLETKERNKNSTQVQLLRTPVDCLRVCDSGPIAVLYPAGIWFHSVSEKNLSRILDWIYDGKGNVDDLIFEVSCYVKNSEKF